MEDGFRKVSAPRIPSAEEQFSEEALRKAFENERLESPREDPHESNSVHLGHCTVQCGDPDCPSCGS